MRRLTWRNGLVLGCTLLVAGYCSAVLVHVQTFPDIGLHSTFSPVVGRSFPSFFRDGAPPPGQSIVGDSIVQVGPFPIETCPQYVRALRLLEHEPIGDGSVLRQEGAERWVRVVLRSPSGNDLTFWCAIGRPTLESTLPAIIWLVLEMGLFLVGALVYWKRPSDRSAGPFFGLAIVAVGAYVGGYHWWYIISSPALLTVFIFSAVLLPAVGLHFHHVFPRPKPWFKRKTTTLVVVYGPSVLTGVALVVGYFWVRSLTRSGAPVAEIQDGMRLLRGMVLTALAVATVSFIAGVGCLLHSYFRAEESSERQQVKWILGGSALALVPIGYSLMLVLYRPLEFVGGGASWPMFIASGFVTAAFTISITRYRLMRLDLLIGSSMVYFLVSFLFGLCYYVAVFTVVLIVGHRVMPGPSFGQAAWVSGSALVLLVIVDLIRGKFKQSLEHHFRRDKHQLDRTLHQLGEAIEHLVETPTLARHLLDVSAELLNVSRGAFFLAETEPALFRLAGTLGRPPSLVELAPGCPLVDALQNSPRISLAECRDDAVGEQLQRLGGELAAGLTYEGRLLGFLILGPKESGYFTPDDLQLLEALAPIAALALQSAAARGAITSLRRDLQDKVEKISEQQGRIVTLQRRLLRQETGTAAVPPALAPLPSEAEIVGSSIVVGQLMETVRKVAASPSAVLIRGESGTGKELLARAIHDHSTRAGQPFVKVHCAALSPTLLESELFGHVKGAFTGATADKIGRFELANGGTLLLDEIGDISLDVQTKLLRVLQEQVFERVGSVEPVRVDVRIVAATHQNLERLMREERFREDLFYRLNVIPIEVPPLRQRREDITELVHHFLARFAAQMGRPMPELDDDALAAIRRYSWPGNVRELRNAIERAVVLSEGSVITIEELPAECRGHGETRASEPEVAVSAAPKRSNPGREDQLRQEREGLVRALADARGNKAEAARALGLARSTFFSKLRKHGLQ